MTRYTATHQERQGRRAQDSKHGCETMLNLISVNNRVWKCFMRKEMYVRSQRRTQCFWVSKTKCKHQQHQKAPQSIFKLSTVLMQSGQSGASRGDEKMQWYGLRNVKKKKKWVQILWVIKYKCNGDRNKGVELFVPSHGWTPPPPPLFRVIFGHSVKAWKEFLQSSRNFPFLLKIHTVTWQNPKWINQTGCRL